MSPRTATIGVLQDHRQQGAHEVSAAGAMKRAGQRSTTQIAAAHTAHRFRCSLSAVQQRLLLPVFSSHQNEFMNMTVKG